MQKINVILWSKDRAAQLDLTLKTYKKHFKEWKDQPLTIICRWSNDFYKSGYDKVIAYHPEFKYIQETDFRHNTLTAIDSSKLEYVTFLVDDDIFLNDMSLDSPEFKEFDTNPLIATISPRLHPGVDFCYTENRPAQKPELRGNRTWKWREGCSGDWSYPWSVAAFHIFRRTDINHLFAMPFRAPNTFEGALCNIPFSGRDLMICFDKAVTFTGANNKVQNENSNRHENSDPLDVLNNNFLIGKRLSENVNSGIIRNCCHGHLNYVWE